MHILLTGASGFVGFYANQALSRNHICTPLADEHGTIDLKDIDRIKSFLSHSNFNPNPNPNSNSRPHLFLSPSQSSSSSSESNPDAFACAFDAVIHLAGQSFVPESFKNPIETYNINFIGTYNLFSALKECGFHGKILYISSGDIYGLVGEDRLSIAEDYPLKPRNPYAVSKVAAEALCYQWSVIEDMEIIIARPFNHIGPNQSERFVVPGFAKQIAEIELGLRKPVISAGNIDVTRDFLDVRDVAEAYKLLLEKDLNYSGNDAASSVYNVCSGTETSIRSVINAMFEITGVDAKIEIDNNKLRRSEQKRVYGNNEKIKKITGWEPKIPLEQSLKDILNYWKERLKK